MSEFVSAVGRVPANLLIALVWVYRRTLSPVLTAIAGPRCRFYPSCSEYAIESLHVHGAIRGGGLALWRLARCQPYARGGFDPVPLPHSNVTNAGAARAR